MNSQHGKAFFASAAARRHFGGEEDLTPIADLADQLTECLFGFSV